MLSKIYSTLLNLFFTNTIYSKAIQQTESLGQLKYPDETVANKSMFVLIISKRIQEIWLKLSQY